MPGKRRCAWKLSALSELVECRADERAFRSEGAAQGRVSLHILPIRMDVFSASAPGEDIQ